MNQKKSSFDRGATNKRVNTHIVDEFQEIENINELESYQSKDRLIEIALIIACKKVAEQNYLSLHEQMNIWIPRAWREN